MGLLKWVCLKKPIFFVLIFVLSFSFCLSTDTYGNDDKSVLVQFKRSLSDPRGILSSWNSDDHYCDWFGVLCDSNGRVTSLNISGSGTGNSNGRFNSSFSSCVQLSEFRLYGIGIRRNCISSNSTGVLIGSLSGVLSKLSELRVLSLPFNELSGEIPLDVWGMQKLEVIDLEGNSIKGTLPVKGVWLRSLRVLNLAFNGIEGGLPSWLSSCQSLEVLNFVGNKVNGTIPASFGSLRKLRGLYLSLNRIGGSIPSDIGEGGCQGLEHLDFSGNLLFGKIPSSLSNCSNLQTLLLYSNMLEEVIPPELGMLKKLKVLDVSRNSLNGLIPVELGNCSELSVLVLSNLFDPFPERFDSRDDSMNLVNDDFNYYQGMVPTEIIALPKLRMLWVPRATLEGRFPRNWGVCDNLEMVNLAHNFISGNIPDELSLCKKLYFLDLSSNRLVGGLSQKLPVPCMTVFDVSGNFLSGPIPVFTVASCISIPSSLKRVDALDDPSSQYVSYFAYKYQVDNLLHFFGEPSGSSGVYHNFGSNNFSGTVQTIPISDDRMGSQTFYAFLAGYNKLSMPFPVQLFANCNNLNKLIINVSNNGVHGQIPQEIGAMCRTLKILDVSGNQINGSLVSGIGDLTSLVSLNLSWNLLQGQIPSSLGQVKDLKSLSLAGNDLTGPIPSSLGLLQSLQFLDLSSNSLDGEIPIELVKLSNLTVLLLNDNKLFGKIPPGLANVTMLSAFNVSFNNLSGLLPLNSNLTKCNSLLGNPFLQSCRMVSLSVPSPDPQGIAANSQSDNDSTPVYSPPRANASFNSIEIASITSASAIVSVLFALIILFFYTRKCNPKSKILGSPRNQVIVFTDIGVPLTFENVVRATGNFNASNCIGNGGFGATYKAEISPGVLVAIKRLAVGRFQGIQQFHAEIKTLGRLRHPNLVTLIGYHASETEMFLIYNYLPGGNLERFIHDRSTRAVDWRILHKIALDVARALAYLHDQCVPRVLHRDVKPSNILLDDDFNAYLSDFGLARLLGTSETHATTGVAGTFGYVAPEYAMTCRVSDKADVYSYGVVLLELLSDKKALDPSFSPYGNGFNIVAWACMLLRQGRAKEFFTTGLWEAGPHDDLVEVLHLAVVCTVDSLSTRPTMKQVVRRLKQLQPPSC